MVSIYIISFYKPLHTLRCLHSLRAHLKGDYEAVLVENNSLDYAGLQDFENLAAAWPQLQIIPLQEQQTCPMIRSQVLEKTVGEYVFFMDNDCFIEEDIFPALINLLENAPVLGGVSTALVYHPSRRLQCLGIELERLENRLFHPRHLRHDLPWDDFKEMAPFVSEFIPGGCSLFKRKFLHDCRYDAGLKNIMGDFDLCLQGRSKGYQYMFHPGVAVFHDKTSADDAYLKAKAALTDWVGGVQRFQHKWDLLYYIYPELEKGRIEMFLGQFPRWLPRDQWPENKSSRNETLQPSAPF